MKLTVLFTIFTLPLCSWAGTPIPCPESRKIEVAPYVSHIEKAYNAGSAKDYVLKLLQKHDLVVIAERAHPEMVQWDWIHEVVSDPFFLAQSGVVFTEYFSSPNQRHLDHYLMKNNGDEEKLRLELLRNVNFWPAWLNRNLSDFLQRVRHLNNSHAREKKLRLIGSDVPFSWDTFEQFKNEQELALQKARFSDFIQWAKKKRDRAIAKQILRKWKALGRPKALIILNTYHGYGPVAEPIPVVTHRAATYLFKYLPGRIANVLVNTPTIGSGSHGGQERLIQHGKWDAAFELSGINNVGFDFKGSPFGNDRFDFEVIPGWEQVTYRDVYTGFVFIGRVQDQLRDEYIDGLLERPFTEIFQRRAQVWGEPYAAQFEALLKTYAPENFGSRPMWSPDLQNGASTWLDCSQ